MAQSRSDQAYHDMISQLQEDLAKLLQFLTDERNQLEDLENAIVAATDTDVEVVDVLPKKSLGEKIYEKMAPYFVSASDFLAHMLEQNKQQTQGAQRGLHDLLQITHDEFNQLTKEEKSKYLLNICAINLAILQDLRILINEYNMELELCLDFESGRENVTEAVINGVATILFDMAPYHPDHEKQFAEYRRQLYSKIGMVDLSIQEFFKQMCGHVQYATYFVQNYKEYLKQETIEQNPSPKPHLLANAINQTLLAPPVAENTADAAVPVQQPTRDYRCSLV